MSRRSAIPRRAQISAFILAGILLIIIFATLFVVVKNIGAQEQGQLFSPEGFVQHCLKLSAEQSLQVLGRHAAVPKLNPLTPKAPSDQRCVSLATSQSKVTLDNLNATESKLPTLINTFLLECLGDFAPLKQQGYQVQIPQPPSSKATFTPEKLVVEMRYPLEFTKGKETTTIQPLYLSMESEYRDIHKLATESGESYIASKEIPLEGFNSVGQTVFITPEQIGVLLIAVDDSSNLYSPINYTMVLT